MCALCKPIHKPDCRYWVFATFTTVGYGDVHAVPTSKTEVLFSVIGMAIGSIVFARLITAVLNIITVRLVRGGAFCRRSPF